MDPLIPKQKPDPSSAKRTSGETGFTPLTKATISAVHASRDAANAPDCAKQPHVETVKVDGIVQSIQVTCSCGELIIIDCQYSE